MSVKAMGLVWDMPCPSNINGIDFKPGHKFLLLAYADHADHNGKSIFPAIPTLAKKTGYKDRNVQYLTHELEQMGVLVPDGFGPRGTNRWCIPFDAGGAKIAPVQKSSGAKTEKSLGANSSGANSSGAKIAPDLKEPEPNQLMNLYNNIDSAWDAVKDQIKNQVKKAQYITWIEPTRAGTLEGRTLKIHAGNSFACEWLNHNIKDAVQQLLGVYVEFTVGPSVTVETAEESA